MRKDQLVELLARPQNVVLSQIALMLGYSEQAALARVPAPVRLHTERAAPARRAAGKPFVAGGRRWNPAS